MAYLNRLISLAVVAMVSAVVAAGTSSAETSRPSDSAVKTTGPIGDVQPQPGRFQLFLAPGHPGSPFLLDTATGCVWHQVQNEQTKRTTFVEVDVENLHWSWGSGAQQVLGARVDASHLSDEQKRLLKDSIQKTGCGLSNVVLTPGQSQGAAQSSGGGTASK